MIDEALSAGSQINESTGVPGPIATIISDPRARVPAVLAVSAARRALIPLDPEWPEERKQAIIKNFACAGILVDESNAFSDIGATDKKIEILGAGLYSAPTPSFPAEPWHDHISRMEYVLFTSGSTGSPKGVGVGLSASRRHIDAFVEWSNLGARDRVFQFARLAFDTSQEEIWPALFAGATLVASVAKLPTFTQLQDRLGATGVTVLELPTAYWRQWSHHLRNKKLSLERLRLMLIGGEAAYERDAYAWRTGALSTVRLVNSYGSTETGIMDSAYEVPATVEDSPRPLPIGKPISPRKFRLDDPVDGVGELLVSSPTLADGYFTPTGLIQNRFLDLPDGRWFRTGDLVESGSDSTYAFRGRVDRRVKILGQRVELEAVEAALLHSGVEEARVEVVDDDRGSPRLSAIVVGEIDSAEIRSRLARTLPPAFVPARIHIVDSLPKNASGKIDVPAVRKMLQATDGAPGR